MFILYLLNVAEAPPRRTAKGGWNFLKAQSFVLTYISQESTSSSPLHEHRGPTLVLPSSVLGLGETTLEELARILPAAPWGVRACLRSVFMD